MPGEGFAQRETPPIGCVCLVSLMTCMTLMRVCRESRESLPVAFEDNGQFIEDHLCLNTESRSRTSGPMFGWR
jgi:hypothetical protein